MHLNAHEKTLTMTPAECYAAFVYALNNHTRFVEPLARVYVAAHRKGQTARDPSYWLANVLAVLPARGVETALTPA